MVISDRTARVLEFLPIVFALSSLVAPVMLAVTSSNLTHRGVNSYFWASTEPPVKF